MAKGATLEGAKGRRTVTVACKIINGMLLQLATKTMLQENGPGGIKREFEQMVFSGPKVKINGPNYDRFGGHTPDYRIVGGYALTEGVDADFFEQWLEQHKNDASVTNRMIYAHGDNAHVVDFAKDHKTAKSGMEGITPDTDPRIPRSKHKNISKIATSDEAKENAA